MITNTFSILSGIGPSTERRLWREGILTWSDFTSSGDISFIPGRRKTLYDENLGEAIERLEARDSSFFGRMMKSTDQWRLFEEFGDDAVCLDIETNGLPATEGGYPTVVGLYGSDGFKAFVRGRDLNSRVIMESLSKYKYLITFYGSVFDIPFLSRSLSGFEVDMPHLDLCFASRSLGYKGGLKKLETTLGIGRSGETTGLDGYDAVLLWKRAQRGDSRALELLVQYNMEDTANLMSIARILYPKLKASTGIEEFT
ncbi:ribonuclease H-like domain-containing protein [Nitrospirota bacterium]